METTVFNRDACKSDQTKKNRIANFEIVQMHKHFTKAILCFTEDCWMMYLLKDRSRLNLTTKGLEATGPALILVDSLLHDTLRAASENDGSYSFLFTKAFVNADNESCGNVNLPIAGIGSKAIFYLNDSQLMLISSMFEKITVEMATKNVYKFDIIRNYIRLILYEAIKIQPGNAYAKRSVAAERITSEFKELLNKQFPIASPHYPLKLKTAGDFAEKLCVHVNHLNSAVRTITGKTTSGLITERIIIEAKALLRNTNWTVSEIAYGLGFEYPTYFNNFFKKHTHVNPLYFRT